MKPTDSDDDDAEVRTDGASAFEIDAGAQMTQEERLKHRFRAYVRVPAEIVLEDWRSRIGIGILLIYLLMGTVGVMFYPAPSSAGPQLALPFQSLDHPFGTDIMGQDLLALIIHSTPQMLLMLASGALATTVVATIVGTVSGYKGGRVDRFLTTISDIFMTIPGFPLVIVLGVIFEPRNPLLVGLLLSVNAWAGLARSIRAQVLTLREENYVEASRTIGVSTSNVILFDVSPNLLPYIAVSFVAAGRRVIFNSVALYFIGALPFESLNWGVVLNQAYRRGALFQWTGWHWIIMPLLAIVLLAIGLILLAQGMERIFNPRIRARHMSDSGASVGAEGEDSQDISTPWN